MVSEQVGVLHRQRVALDAVDRTGRRLAGVWLRHGESLPQAVERLTGAAAGPGDGGPGGRAADHGASAPGHPVPGPVPVAVSSTVIDVPAAGSAAVRLHRIGLHLTVPVGDGVGRPDALTELTATGLADPGTPGRYAGHGGTRRGPIRIQRPGAYAVVRRDGRVLLTLQHHHAERRIDLWGLPGGGIDHGEHPDEAVRREVAEESGLSLSALTLAGTGTAHWTGRAPDGTREDFHAVHLLYTGIAPPGARPRVVEVDGSTASVAWVDEREAAALSLTPSAAAGLRLVGALPGGG